MYLEMLLLGRILSLLLALLRLLLFFKYRINGVLLFGSDRQHTGNEEGTKGEGYKNDDDR